MDTIFMNSKNSKISDTIINLTDKMLQIQYNQIYRYNKLKEK